MDIERLIAEHKDAIYRQVVRACGDADDAEDALADAILAALKSGDQLRDEAKFKAWMAAIGSRICVRNRIRQRLRANLSLQEMEAMGLQLADESPDAEEIAEVSALKACIEKTISQLPDIYREVYVRREIQSVPAEAVARELGLSIPALKSRLHRAREIVRDLIDNSLGCWDMAT